MAEALGVAGSVVSFVGLAGQVAQGVNYLYNFFDSVQDAPSDIRSLAGDLKVLGEILDEVGRDGIESAPLTAALQRCKDVIADLESLVQKSKLTSEQSKARRLWLQMSIGFRNEKFRKHIEKLEGAKSTLLHAKLQAHGTLHHQQLNGIKTIQESLNRTATEHSEFTTRSSETARLIQTDLQTLPSRVKDGVVDEISTTMAKSHATWSTILTEFRTSSIKSDQTNEEIKLAIQSLLSDPGTSRIAALLQPALEKVISDQIAASLETLTAHLASLQPSPPSRTPDPEVGNSISAIPASTENQIGVRSLNQLSATTTCIRWAGSSKVINFWFGRLIISTAALESWQGSGNGATLQKAEFLETKVTLIPAKWLLRKGAVLKITRLVSAIVAPSIQFSLTPIMVIPDDHEIVSAMRHGGLTRVQQLIFAGEVHPASILPDGSSLLHACVAAICEQILHNPDFVRYKKDSFMSAKDGSQETILTIYKMIEIAVWLVAHGAAADTPNIYGRNSFDVLDKIYSQRWLSFTDEVFDRLNPLATAILRSSDFSPFFVRDPGGGQLKLTDTLISTWHCYRDLIVKGTSPDSSTLLSLTALQSLWSRTPYNQGYKVIDCLYPEFWASELTRAAIAGKLWLSGDDCESKRCLRMLYCSIRDALVYASPYRQFKDNHFTYRRSRMKHLHRSEMIYAIADLLRYEKDVPMYEGRPRLTECAITWRCLDIWKRALEEAECQPLSSAIWNDHSHCYDSLGFVSCESGTSVSLTGDPISDNVILVVGERQYADMLPYGKNRRKRYPVNPEFTELTQDWQCALNLRRVHCEVYPSRTVETELVGREINHASHTDGAHSTSKYTLQPMEDGGIELFIDCCEVGEPWERIWADVMGEPEQDPDESMDGSQTSGEESIDSDDNEEESDGASPGVFSKIAGFGLDVMSAFV